MLVRGVAPGVGGRRLARAMAWLRMSRFYRFVCLWFYLAGMYGVHAARNSLLDQMRFPALLSETGKQEIIAPRSDLRNEGMHLRGSHAHGVFFSVPQFNYTEVDVVVVMVTPVCVTQQTIKLLRFNFNFRKIYYIVKHKEFCPYLESIDPHVVCVDENSVLPGVSYADLKAPGISDNIKKHQGIHNRVGWYLQQYLKLGVALHGLPGLSEHYLVWDADNIPIKPFQMFGPEGNAYFCANPSKQQSVSYSKYYMAVTGMELLHPERGGKFYNFVCGYMMFYRPFVKEMLDFMDDYLIKTGKIKTRKGFPWNLHEMADQLFQSNGMFSEYDSYGSFVMQKHPEYFKMDYSITYTRNPTTKLSTGRKEASFVNMRCCLNQKRICELGKEEQVSPHGKLPPPSGRHHFLIWEEHKFRYREDNNCMDDLPTDLEQAVELVGTGMVSDDKKRAAASNTVL